MSFSNSAPNGFLIDDLIIFNRIAKNGCAVKGLRIEAPNFRQAPDSILNDLQHRLRYLLQGKEDDERWQCSQTNCSNFDQELSRFENITATVAHPWIRKRREEVTRRYRELMVRGELRRRQLVIFISKRIDSSVGWWCNRQELMRHHQAILDQLTSSFQTRVLHFQQALAPLGVRVTPMTDEDHFLSFARMLNPALADSRDEELLRMYDPNLSVLDNAWRSEGTGHSGGGLALGGAEHSMVVVSRLPQFTTPRTMDKLTALKLRDYQIVLNIEALPVGKEIGRIERKLARVRGDLAAGGPARLKTAIEVNDSKIAQLSSGFVKPFRIRLVVRTWASSRDAVRDQMAAIKHAIISMNSAQFLEPTLPSTTGNLFIETLPGWTFGPYDYHKLDATDAFLPDLIPFAPSFTGYLQEADAIVDGPDGSMVGIRISSRGSPEHAFLSASTGAGKTVLATSLLSQFAHRFGRILILDADGSWIPFLQEFEPTCKPIVLGPKSNSRINYLSTDGLPLLPDMLATIVGVVEAMAGRHLESDKQQSRRACIEHHVQGIFDHSYTQWCRRHPELLMETGRMACAINELAVKAGIPWHEAYLGFNDLRGKNSEVAVEYLSRVDEGRAVRASVDPALKRLVRDLAFAVFENNEYPTHSMLQELMQLQGASANRQEAKTIAQNLKPFNRGGSAGELIDGESCVTTRGKAVCFELGSVTRESDAFGELCGRLALGALDREVFRSPRDVEKGIILEESSNLITAIRQGAQIIPSLYERARKHGAWVCSIFQQYGRVSSESKAFRSALMGNVAMAFLLRQHDEKDLLELAEDLGLSRTAVEAIKGYGIPNREGVPPAFTYFHRDTPLPICGTAYNVLPPDTLRAFSSAGRDFERRRQTQSPAALVEQLVMSLL